MRTLLIREVGCALRTLPKTKMYLINSRIAIKKLHAKKTEIRKI